MLTKILVPTDGSAMALKAAKYALTLGEKFDSEITLLHIIQNYYDMPTFSVSESVTLPRSILNNIEKGGELVLEKTLAALPDYSGKINTRMEYGPPGKVTVEIAYKENYSLIVMGRRGLNSFAGFLLGSVSNHVVHYASCPTLIVKTNEPTPENE
ncbi:MAG: UspA protein [Firmicutes bacterium]|nr:UspA protein [Bacillota bacterium]